MEKTQTNSVAIPPKIFKRNEFGLIDDGSVVYIFNEDGTINWRKMVKPEYLKPNKQHFQRFNKPIPESVEGLEDNELIILLGGLKELAQIRGYKAVLPYKVTSPSNEYVVAVASIIWIPNYETEGREVQFSAIGDASPNNTSGFGKNYLGAFAENRAFVRCIRNFLKINIVSQEEIGGPIQNDTIEDTSLNLLQNIMNKHGISFEDIKRKLINDKVEGAENFTNISQISKFKQLELISRIIKAAEHKAES